MAGSNASAATLEDISYSTLPGDRVQIRMKLSEPVAEEPLSFTIDNPARIALDLPDTQINLAQRSRAIGVGGAESVLAVEAEDRTRVVVNLSRLVPYAISTQGDVIAITLEGGGASLARTPATTQSLPGTATGASIADIDFRRGAGGEAQVLVNLSAPDIGINITQQGDNIVVDFAETALPENLDRKLDVADFATPAREIDTFREGNGTRMVIAERLVRAPRLPVRQRVHDGTAALTAAEEEQCARTNSPIRASAIAQFQNIEVRAVRS